VPLASPLILLHPFPFDRRFWDPLRAQLAPGRPVVCPDMPGFGDAARRPGWSIADAADAIGARIADELPGGRAAVCGLSMGGYVALALARRAPERIAALVLADTRGEADSDEARAGRAAAIAAIEADGLERFVDAQLERLLAVGSPGEIRCRLRAIAAEQPPESVTDALRALAGRPDRTGELAAIEAPTLVIVGDDDAITPPDAAGALASGIAGATLRVMPGVGHLSAAEAPKEFAEHLERFLAGAAHPA
jgi:3-oxoadipate enol-lactonase